MKLYANLLTFNRLPYIKNLISQLTLFCDKIIAVDSYSTDGTYEYLKTQKGVKVYQHKWEGFGEQRQVALDKTPKDVWMLRIDSDEIPSLGMIDNLHSYLSLMEIYKGKSYGFYIPIYTLINDLQHYTPDAWSAEMRIFYNNKKLNWTKGAHEILAGDIPQGVLDKSIALIHFDRLDKELVREKQERYKDKSLEFRDYESRMSEKPLPFEISFLINKEVRKRL